MWVVLVANHKTAKKGPAQLTVTDTLKMKLNMYLQVVRKVCDPLDDHDKYLSMPEGQQVTGVFFHFYYFTRIRVYLSPVA